MNEDAHRDRASPEGTPRDTAEAFFFALRSGDEIAIWALFSEAARRFIVDRGIRRGLDRDVADAVVARTAEPAVMRQFLADVVAGLEKDLEGVRLDRIVFEDESRQAGGEKVKIAYLEAFEIAAGPDLPPLPVGSLILAPEDGEWRVDRLVPRPG